MELTADQETKFKALCKEIKSSDYGRVVVSFIGKPSNIVQITGEKNFRFHNERYEPTEDEAHDRPNTGLH